MIVHVEPSFALPIVSIAVAFSAGATSDQEGKEGLARVTARMLRRGAEGLTPQAIEEGIDALGGELAGEVGLSWSSFGMEVIERNLDPFVELVARILGTPRFDEVELGKLLRETESEIIEARDSDRALAARALRQGTFSGHPYARRTSGTVDTVRGLTRADASAYYTRHYNRANAVVAVAGYVTHERALSVAEKLLRHLPVGEKTPDVVSEPVRRPGRRLFFVDKPERTQMQMAIGSLGSHPRDDDHVPLSVANTVFGGTFTARLMREIRSKRGWSYGASSRLGVELHREAFSMWTAPAVADAAPCLSLELALLEKWQAKGVTAKELSFAKSYLARSHVFEIDTANKRVHQRLDTDLLDLPADYYSRYVEHVKGVSLLAANAAVASRITPADLAIAVVGTHAKIGKAIEDAIPNLDEVTVLPFDRE